MSISARPLKKILITGGAGFIGHHLCAHLLNEGFNVHVLDDLSSGDQSNLPEASRHFVFQKGSILNLKDLREAFGDVDAVVHLAALASVNESMENPLNSLHPNVVGFMNVLEIVRKKNPAPRVVYASSASVYGNTESICCEDNPPAKALSPYGADKQINELHADLYMRVFGLSCLGLRIFNAYGKGQNPSSPYSGVITHFTNRIKREEPIIIYGDGRQSRDFIHIRDVVRAIRLALHSDLKGVVNIASGESVSINTLIATIEQLLNGRVGKREEPPRAGEVMHSRAHVARARSALGFEAQVQLSTGLYELLEGVPAYALQPLRKIT